jgi:hypothetical protein
MKKLYHLYNENFEITHAQIFEEGQQPNNAVYIELMNLIKPKVNPETLEVYEGATTEEIANQQAQEKETFVRAFMQKKAEDGQAYASEIRFRITKELIGKPIAEVNEIDAQCQTTVMPLLQLIEGVGADWWSAMNRAFATTEPTNAIALTYFNEVKGYIINYVQTNYPSEL